MDMNQQTVFEALSRARLIFPHQLEMWALRDEAKEGPLISDEADRLVVLEKAYKIVQGYDKTFHSALLKGNHNTALEAAEAAQAIIEDIP